MRDTEKHRLGPRSGRSPRFGDPMEQAGTMGKRRAVRRDDRPALDPVSDQIQKIAPTFERRQAHDDAAFQLHGATRRVFASKKFHSPDRAKRIRNGNLESLLAKKLYPAGPPGGSRPAGLGGHSIRSVASNEKRPGVIATRSARALYRCARFFRCP